MTTDMTTDMTEAARSGGMVDRTLRQGYAWACERLYHELAWGYDLVSIGVSAGRWDAWRLLALDFVQRDGDPAGAPLLEIGFGTGALLAAACMIGIPIVGLDLSPDMHAVAAARLAARRLDAPRVRATMAGMPFPDRHFGAVLATFPAPAILESATLRECARVLRDDGRLIVVGLWVTPHMAGRRLQLPLLYGEPSPAFKAKALAMMESAGFEAGFAMRMAGDAEIGVLIGRNRCST